MCLTCNAPPLTPSTSMSCTGQALTQWTGNAHGTHLEHLSAGPLFCTCAGKGSKENSILLFKIGRLLAGLDMQWQRGCPFSALFLPFLTCSPLSLPPPTTPHGTHSSTLWMRQTVGLITFSVRPFMETGVLAHFSLLASLLSPSEVRG